MKSPGKNTLFIICFCLSFCVLNISAQRNKDEIEIKSDPVEIKSAPVEIRNETPPPSPPVDSTPVYQAPEPEPIKVEVTREIYNQTPNKEPKDDLSPTNPPPVIITVDRGDGRRNSGKDEDKKDKKKHDYENCPYYDLYGNCTYTPNDTTYVNGSYNTGSVSSNGFFNGNDLAFNGQRFIQKNQTAFLPYFAGVLTGNYKPLYTVGVVEPKADLPYITPFWVFYYEPDLDNFFIDFSKFNQAIVSSQAPVRFERLVLLAADKKTIRKTGEKFGYKGEVRPVLVEDISGVAQDRIYTFNIAGLSKGKYELLLISRTGDTAKLEFKLK